MAERGSKTEDCGESHGGHSSGDITCKEASCICLNAATTFQDANTGFTETSMKFNSLSQSLSGRTKRGTLTFLKNELWGTIIMNASYAYVGGRTNLKFVLVFL